MRQPHAGNGGEELRHDVERGVAPANLAAKREDQGHRRIEMRARNRPEDIDQDDEAGPGRKRVAEQGDGDVAAREALAHDARADHDGEQEGGSQRFGDKTACNRHAAVSQQAARAAISASGAQTSGAPAQQSSSRKPSSSRIRA
jgi:hypothetical protein